MWKVDNKKEISYLKLLAKTQSIEIITAPPNHQAFPRNFQTTAPSETDDLTADLPLSHPSSKSSPSFSPSSLYQTTCCTFFFPNFHQITQIFSANFPHRSCCYPTPPLPPMLAGILWKHLSQSCQISRQAIKAGRHVSYLHSLSSPSCPIPKFHSQLCSRLLVVFFPHSLLLFPED